MIQPGDCDIVNNGWQIFFNPIVTYATIAEIKGYAFNGKRCRGDSANLQYSSAANGC